MNQASEPPVAPIPQTVEPSGQRDEKGRFIPGHEKLGGNTKGSISIIGIIKERLAEVPIGQRRTLAETLAEQILDAAIVLKDGTMQRELLHYMDGMPNQKIDFGVDKENIGELTAFLSAIAKKTDDTERGTDAGGKAE